MVRQPVEREEILHNSQQPLHRYLHAQLLTHLAPKRRLGRLQELAAPARQRPEVFAFRAVQQHTPIMYGDSRHTIDKPSLRLRLHDHVSHDITR